MSWFVCLVEHENPLEENFVDSNVEIIKPETVPVEKEVKLVEKIEKEAKEEETANEGEDPQPVLSVIRNSIEDSERRKQEYINKIRDTYRDDNSCSSEHM